MRNFSRDSDSSVVHDRTPSEWDSYFICNPILNAVKDLNTLEYWESIRQKNRVHIKKLNDVDMAVPKELITQPVRYAGGK